MKKYYAPSFEAEELKISDIIAVSNQIPHFVKEGTATAGEAADEKTVNWNPAWNVD